jgi:ATP-dependent Clp protease ATP-binding subunit ClpA
MSTRRCYPSHGASNSPRAGQATRSLLSCDSCEVFERFDERAYRVVVCAGIEARDRRYGHVGTESLLMGLLLEANESAGTSEASSDLVERVREVVGQRGGAGLDSDPEARVIELTPRARQVLERAAYEAAQEQAPKVSPAHILLAATSVAKGEGLIALDALNISPNELRAWLYG